MRVRFYLCQRHVVLAASCRWVETQVHWGNRASCPQSSPAKMPQQLCKASSGQLQHTLRLERCCGSRHVSSTIGMGELRGTGRHWDWWGCLSCWRASFCFLSAWASCSDKVLLGIFQGNSFPLQNDNLYFFFFKLSVCK